MNHKSKIYLLLILVISFLLRLYGINNPLADWHSFRQADTASVAREYYKQKINLLVPKYHDMSDIQSKVDNPMGYRMVEFPIIPALVAFTFKSVSFTGIELHVWFRLINIIFSLFSIILIFLISKLLFNPRVALYAAASLGFMPFSVYYSRTTLPEVAMITFVLAGTLCGLLNRKSRLFDLLSILFFSLSLLLKPFSAIFILPVLIYIVLNSKQKLSALIYYPLLYSFSFLPLLFWRTWITQYPQGIPTSDWLFNSDGIRLRPAWFRWLFYERLSKLILGFFGLIPFISGLASMRLAKIYNLKSKIYIIALMLSSLTYLIVIASGNVRHDYYQFMLTPVIALVLALGLDYLLSTKNKLLRFTILVSCTLSLVTSFSVIRGYYNINNWAMIRAGEAIDKLTPFDTLVIAPYFGDTAFLYATNRRGWPIGFEIDKKIAAGARFYVTTTYDDEARALEAKYETIAKTDEYLILKFF